MVDHISFDISNLPTEYLRSHPDIDWTGCHGMNTAELKAMLYYPTKINPLYVGEHRQLRFEIYRPGTYREKRLRFSPVNHFRDGQYSLSCFTKDDFKRMLKALNDRFYIHPQKVSVHCIDTFFDLQLHSYWELLMVLKHPMFHETPHAPWMKFDTQTFTNGGVQRKLERRNYNLKLYHKGYDLGRPHLNILRMECKTKRMRDLKEYLNIEGKLMLSDIYERWDDIAVYTKRKFRECFIFDYTIKDNFNIPPTVYAKYSNINYWENLDYKERKKELLNYKSICAEHGLQLNNWIRTVIEG